MTKFLITLVMCFFATFAIAEPTKVDVELVILMDSSNSLSIYDIQDQRQIIMECLMSPNVLNIIEGNFHQTVAIQVMEFSDEDRQKVVIDWTKIKTKEDILQLSDEFTQKKVLTGFTATGAGLIKSIESIQLNNIESSRRAIIFVYEGFPDDLTNILTLDTRASDGFIDFYALMYVRDEDRMRKMIEFWKENLKIGSKSMMTDFYSNHVEELFQRVFSIEMF